MHTHGGRDKETSVGLAFDGLAIRRRQASDTRCPQTLYECVCGGAARPPTADIDRLVHLDFGFFWFLLVDFDLTPRTGASIWLVYRFWGVEFIEQTRRLHARSDS